MRSRIFSTFLSVSIVSAALLASACSSSSETPANTTSASTVTKPVGPEGGKIEVGGAVVTFPPGAVSASTSITISVVESGVPDGFVALSKVFKCEPAGTDFAQPVEMRMPFTDDGKGGTLFWQSGNDPAFKNLGGRVEGNVMIASVQHFSGGFVGRAK
jgi:hypothetical protein